MEPKDIPQLSPVGIIASIIWLFVSLGMLVSWVIIVITWWRAMKAHERIADKLTQIADKFGQK